MPTCAISILPSSNKKQLTMAAQQSNNKTNAKTQYASAASKDNAVIRVLNGRGYMASNCTIM